MPVSGVLVKPELKISHEDNRMGARRCVLMVSTAKSQAMILKIRFNNKSAEVVIRRVRPHVDLKWATGVTIFRLSKRTGNHVFAVEIRQLE